LQCGCENDDGGAYFVGCAVLGDVGIVGKPQLSHGWTFFAGWMDPALMIRLWKPSVSTTLRRRDRVGEKSLRPTS
jgi:hypothetical protein